MLFNVFKGEYPFNEILGTVEAEDELVAFDIAQTIYGGHPAVQPVVCSSNCNNCGCSSNS